MLTDELEDDSLELDVEIELLELVEMLELDVEKLLELVLTEDDDEVLIDELDELDSVSNGA